MIIEFFVGPISSIIGGFLLNQMLKKNFEKEVQKTVRNWVKTIPENLMPSGYSFETVFFEEMDDPYLSISTKQREVRNQLRKGLIPDEKDLIQIFLERRTQVLQYHTREGSKDDVVSFFTVEDKLVLPDLKRLAENIYNIFVLNDRTYKLSSYEKIKDINLTSHKIYSLLNSREKSNKHKEIDINTRGDSHTFICETPEIFSILIAILVRETTTKELLFEDLKVIYKSLFKRKIKIANIDSFLSLLTENGDINISSLTIKLSKKGKEKLSNLTNKNWELLESITYDEEFCKYDIAFYLFKYIVEKIPSKIRFKKLVKIIQFLQEKYYKLNWKYKNENKEIIVPFQIVEEIKGNKLITCLSEESYSEELLIDHKYLKYYEYFAKYNHRIHNGSVYRIIDWKKSRKNICLYVACDYGYFDFQATCGKIRNEIEHKLSNQFKSTEINLPYRTKTLHNNLDRDEISRYMKKRVLKTGIEVCTIIVDHDHKGKIVNPRVPIIFRNGNVSEYPDFTMVVPSGAYQAGIKIKDVYLQDEERAIKNRIDWQFSLKRELGEELFRSKELDKSTIHDLGILDYQVSEQIVNEALLCKAQAFGIDLYIGSGGIIVTLIIDYSTTLEVLSNFMEKAQDNSIIKKMTESFTNLNDDGELLCKEGKIRLFDLSEEFLDIVSNSYALKENAGTRSLKQYRTGELIKMTPMIPSGVISVFYAREEFVKFQQKQGL